MDGHAAAARDPWGEPTRWSMIQRAAEGPAGTDSDRAWAELIERYREPVERALRRRLAGQPNVEERVAEFFGYLFEKRVLPRVDPDQGRFRCFIQGVLRNFCSQAVRGEKRGRASSLETSEFSLAGLAEEPGQEEMRDWALAVLQHAIAALLEQHERDGTLLLRAYGLPPHEAVAREALAEESGLTRNALDVAIHRARKRLATLIQQELRECVCSRAELLDEEALVREHLLVAFPALLSD